MRRLAWMGLLLGIALAGCAPSGSQTQAPAPRPVWPAPPAQARIVWQAAIAGPEDLDIRPGFFARLWAWVAGAEERRFIRPMAVVWQDEVLYVADPGARGVHRLDHRNQRYDLVHGPEDGELPSPVALALGPDGTVYVADSQRAQVLTIAPGATTATPLPLAPPPGQPTGLALDAARGELYVADTAAHRVQVYGPDGQQRRTLGTRGTGRGEFNYPTALWRDAQGALIVSDSMNFRIQVLDAQGRAQQVFGRHGDATGDFARPKGVATDRDGHIYVVDGLFHAVQIFDRSGRFLLSFGGHGRGAGEFWLPSGIHAGQNDRIYVADAHNQRVQVFQYQSAGGAP